MSATGQDTKASSTPSFVSALVVAAITVGAFSLVFVCLHGRRNLRRVFQPRVELAPESKRPESLPGGLVSFWRTVLKNPDQNIIVANGVDAYLFVRYLKVFGVYMLVPYFVLTFVACIPAAAVKPNAHLDGLNVLTFGNVPADAQNRHIAHGLVAVILMGWTLYLLWREYNHFVDIRQAWLSSPQHLSLARTRTVALTGLPDSVNSESGIKELGGIIGRLTGSSSAVGPRTSNLTDGTAVANGNGRSTSPDLEIGGIRSVWLSKKVKPVEKVWQEREDECSRLEGGVAKLVKLGNKNYRKGKTPEKQGKFDTEGGATNMVDRFVLPKKRPSWKQGPLGLFGKKMTLETSPVYISEHNAELEKFRADADSLPQANTAFVRFGSQAEAHSFARLVSSTDKAYRKIETGVEVVPEDIQWSNISMSTNQRKIRTVISWALTIGLIIIWAIPVAFVGIVSNVDTLCATASWLAWICKLPSPALGIIKGVLPPVLLAVLFMLLPIILRIWIRLQGEVQRSVIELKLFSRFWLFQVIHGFLIVTVASGLVGALQHIGSEVSQLPTLLATNLPTASIFFLTFILVATFSAAAQAYSRATPYVMWLLKGVLAGNTPRKVFVKTYKMDSFAWATTWPPVCLIICITMVYSVIQPIMCLLSLVAFSMMYMTYKYLLYWTTDQPDSLETGGLFYIKALRTVFVALYIEGICLAGLFFLSTDQNGKRATSGLAFGAIMAAMLVFTAVFQIYIDWFRFRQDFLVYSHASHGPTPKLALSQSKISQTEAAVARVATSASDEANIAGPELGNTSGFHANAFYHPALWKKQPVVWIADDQLGIGKFESARINEAQVESSTEFNHMDEKGTIVVERGPPDEAWYGGFTAQ